MQNLLQVDLFLQVSGITPGRAVSLLAGVIGLIGIVIGWMALSRTARRISSGRQMGIVALAMGLIGMVLGGLHLASTTGGFGTGKGRAGAIVAMVIGLIGLILGRRALTRARRIATGSNSITTASPREKI
jgi:xanthosine utilization system XapX-like protein